MSPESAAIAPSSMAPGASDKARVGWWPGGPAVLGAAL